MKINFFDRKGNEQELQIKSIFFAHSKGLAYFETMDDKQWEIDISRINNIRNVA